jgi:hypothetical protein
MSSATSPRYITIQIEKALGRSVLLAEHASGISRYADRQQPQKETKKSVRAYRYKRRSTDRDALDVEDQVRVGGNVRGRTLLAVCERGGDGKATLTTWGHAGDTDVPALDDLADTELEGEWLALFVGCM